MKLIGLSLSFCIADIIKGKVDENDVVCIVAATSAQCRSCDLDKVIETYRATYWESDPDRAENITRRWFNMGKIHQPLLMGKEHPGVADGWWKEISDYDFATIVTLPVYEVVEAVLNSSTS